MSEIAAASEGQSASVEQVNMAVTQMDEVTHQTAALVEDASAAVQSMAQHAQDLSEVVAVFKVGDPGSAGTSIRRTGTMQLLTISDYCYCKNASEW
ncbi:hypothetical protein DID96_37330 [Burkholderia sp. Bp8963]|nr:hypothetical protein DID96_37330 [Burkholderia sp. Bp8963]